MTFYEHHKPEPPKRNRRNGHNGAAHAEAPAEVNLVCMSEVTPRPIDWLWLGRLARRKLTLITGDPDLGKSQIGLDMIARITTARPWPDEAGGSAPLGDCVILSAEDAAADTLHPRLEAADSDLGRVHTVKSVIRRDHDGKPHLACKATSNSWAKRSNRSAT
jgi:AAA domain